MRRLILALLTVGLVLGSWGSDQLSRSHTQDQTGEAGRAPEHAVAVRPGTAGDLTTAASDFNPRSVSELLAMAAAEGIEVVERPVSPGVTEYSWQVGGVLQTVRALTPLTPDLGSGDLRPQQAEGSGGGAAPVAGEVLYTWQDGEDTRSVWLQTGVAAQPSSEDGPDDAVPGSAVSESIVGSAAERDLRPAGPVFRSEGGMLMTLPGGVILVLEESWDAARASQFFQERSISPEGAVPMGFAPNAFFVETEPGFPSLTLANSLAEAEGVVIAVPNWQSEMVLQ